MQQDKSAKRPDPDAVLVAIADYARTFTITSETAFDTARDPEADISTSYGTFLIPETYIIDKNGKVVEMQLDDDAIDPTKVVVACQAQKLNR